MTEFTIDDLRFAIWSSWRRWVGAVGFLVTVALSANATTNSSANRATVIVVVGAPGEPEFGSNFVRQTALWEKTCQQADYREITLGLDASSTNDYDHLRQILDAEPKTGPGPLWLVLIGHGTFDGKEARFNLRGPDVSATDLALWLKPFQRPMAIVGSQYWWSRRRASVWAPASASWAFTVMRSGRMPPT